MKFIFAFVALFAAANAGLLPVAPAVTVVRAAPIVHAPVLKTFAPAPVVFAAPQPIIKTVAPAPVLLHHAPVVKTVVPAAVSTSYISRAPPAKIITPVVAAPVFAASPVLLH